MKSTFVCLLLGCASLSFTQSSTPRSRDSVEVQHLLKFSGKLSDSPRGGFIGRVTVRFKLYNDPDGVQACWEETQDVRPDTQGRYTVSLGETTLGDLPPEIFASPERHWLGVQPVGQPEQARLLLVELPSAWKPDPITPSAAPTVKKAILPSDPTERHLAEILAIMFLLGAGLACGETVKWWKRRTEQLGEPPFANLLSSAPSPGKLRRVAQVLAFPVSASLRSIHESFREPVQTVHHDDQPKNAA